LDCPRTTLLLYHAYRSPCLYQPVLPRQDSSVAQMEAISYAYPCPTRLLNLSLSYHNVFKSNDLHPIHPILLRTIQFPYEVIAYLPPAKQILARQALIHSTKII